MKLDINVFVSVDNYKNWEGSAIARLLEVAYGNLQLRPAPDVYRVAYQPSKNEEHAKLNLKALPAIVIYDPARSVVLDIIYQARTNPARLAERTEFLANLEYDPTTGEYITPAGDSWWSGKEEGEKSLIPGLGILNINLGNALVAVLAGYIAYKEITK